MEETYEVDLWIEKITRPSNLEKLKIELSKAKQVNCRPTLRPAKTISLHYFNTSNGNTSQGFIMYS